jgi:ATP/ADP translocase
LKKTKGKKSDLDASWKGTLVKAQTLFQDVPILGKLFIEVISFQTLMAVINLCFITRLKHEITDDSERAAYTGQLYALVNGISALFQFVLLPNILQKVPLVWILRLMPILPIICIFVSCFQREPSLAVVAFTLLATKTMVSIYKSNLTSILLLKAKKIVKEYSTRNVVNEMIYIGLDFNSRYLGKEIVGAFGTKLGKSLISLVLSLLPYYFGDIPEFNLVVMAAVAAINWLISAFTLSSLTSPKEIEKKRS